MREAGQLEGWHDYLELKKMLKALADVVRLNIVHALAREGEVTVTELTQRLLISQPLVSWHLTMLRHAGLVRTRRQGRLVFCSLDQSRCALCLGLLGETLEVAEVVEVTEVAEVAEVTHGNDDTPCPPHAAPPAAYPAPRIRAGRHSRKPAARTSHTSQSSQTSQTS